MKKEERSLPFRIDRNVKTNLTQQVADGFRQAIRGGFYKTGDTLPTIRALAPALGVSVRVTAEAVKELTAEGLIAPRPRLGSVVLGKGETLWKGQVLVVLPEGDYGYYQNELIGRIRAALFNAGYLFTQATVPLVGGRKYDTSVLALVLGKRIDLAVALFDCPAVLKTLARSGVSYITVAFHENHSRHCMGSIRFEPEAGIADFVRHCSEVGVKRVLQIGKGSGEADAVTSLNAAGIAAERMNIPLRRDRNRLEEIQRATIDLFRGLAVGGKPDWPDVLYLTDDYLAMAAILSLEHLRVRVPDDVRVVTLSNRGHGPVAWDTLTRMEMDPVSHGDTVAGCILSFLRGRGFPRDVKLRSVYRIGASFPRVSLFV